ncbi:hypothetical protein COO60DRAFT_1569873 [Scenedesmus sp. NREL 46B-D3]|nr:hypothetical protein COO60DRAFT_1569873 [Scenedesmus sp. NREL 46B-D3]
MAAMTFSTNVRCFTSTSKHSRTAARPQRVLPAVQRVPGTRDVRAAFFNFGKLRTDSSDAGIYGSQGRNDFTVDDVEHYFNYMGMLAVEGTYDRMEQMLSSGLDPVDVLLLMAASENDLPKVEELLAAGADISVKDSNNKTPLELAAKEEVVAAIKAAQK